MLFDDGRVLEAVFKVTRAVFLSGSLQSVSYYVTPKIAIRATRRGKRDRRGRHEEILVSYGRLNYREREYLKKTEKRSGVTVGPDGSWGPFRVVKKGAKS